ncbi:MAG: hypothetical protein HRU20_01275 [Pseudomonadales bacterium]|nr:hypothetical protein [Pseudomonadales bacterium]
MIKISLTLLIIAISHSILAAEVGKPLTALSIESTPNNFFYAANGKTQLITVYPAKPSSAQNGVFNQHAQAQGICPLSLTDINNKAWYAPVSMVESELKKEAESVENNPLGCTVSSDYAGLAVKQWQLKEEAATIVVDGSGEIIFLAYGVLSEAQEQAIFTLFI